MVAEVVYVYPTERQFVVDFSRFQERSRLVTLLDDPQQQYLKITDTKLGQPFLVSVAQILNQHALIHDQSGEDLHDHASSSFYWTLKLVDADRQIAWPTSSRYPIAHLSAGPLGKRPRFSGFGEPAAQIAKALIENGLTAHTQPFPQDVLREARDIVAAAEQDLPNQVARRTDLRNFRIFSVDPAGAGHQDDAVHVRYVSDRVVELGVHIADVAHYVKPGSKVDLEARRRFVGDGVVGMQLSRTTVTTVNGVCVHKYGPGVFSCNSVVSVSS